MSNKGWRVGSRSCKACTPDAPDRGTGKSTYKGVLTTTLGINAHVSDSGQFLTKPHLQYLLLPVLED